MLFLYIFLDLCFLEDKINIFLKIKFLRIVLFFGIFDFNKGIIIY